jgi:hypothetical protein
MILGRRLPVGIGEIPDSILNTARDARTRDLRVESFAMPAPRVPLSTSSQFCGDWDSPLIKPYRGRP